MANPEGPRANDEVPGFGARVIIVKVWGSIRLLGTWTLRVTPGFCRASGGAYDCILTQEEGL